MARRKQPGKASEQKAKEREIVLDQPGETKERDDGQWWLLSDEEIGPAAVRAAQRYDMAMVDRREESRRYGQLHKGKLLTSSMHDAASARRLEDDVSPAWNVIQAAVNTEMSVITRNKVRAQVDTRGAEHDLQEDVKECELFIAGVFARNKLYEEIDRLWFIDADVSGLGAVMAEDTDDGDTTLRRLLPDGLVYPEQEWMAGKGRQFFYVEWMSKWDAIAKYASDPDDAAREEKAQAIRDCNTTFNAPIPGQPDRAIILIPVWTCWFLPSRANMPTEAPEKGEDVQLCDGRKVVAVPGDKPGCTLRVRPWQHTRLPISFLRIERNQVGHWGIGAAERLAGFQHRLNEINYLLLEQFRGGSHGKWMVDTGAGVNDDELTDEENTIVHYTTKKPEWELNNGAAADLLQERTETYNQALKERGLSEWLVGGVQPENIESGEGLRMLEKREEGRALPAGQEWEAAHIDLVECVVIAASDAADTRKRKDLGPLTVIAKDEDGDGLTAVEWDRIARILTDPDSRLIQAYPTSTLPTDPAGKADKLWEWRKEGRIDAAGYAALSEMPDTDAEASLQLEGVKAVRHIVAEIARRGPEAYEPPDITMPLQYGLQLAQRRRLRGFRQGMPEANMQALWDWAADCLELLNKKPLTPPVDDVTAQQPVAPMPVEGAPAAGGAPAPAQGAPVDGAAPMADAASAAAVDPALGAAVPV
jgi:hypothetical protein